MLSGHDCAPVDRPNHHATNETEKVPPPHTSISSDRFFDALTVRLFATSLDYTITDGEPPRVVAGSRQKQRRYSEYWTLIRSAGKTGAARADANCPSCGAPLRIEMAGHCAYCRAKVTSGEFDWVLSRIEQDDVYDG